MMAHRVSSYFYVSWLTLSIVYKVDFIDIEQAQQQMNIGDMNHLFLRLTKLTMIENALL